MFSTNLTCLCIDLGVFPGCSFVLTSWYSPAEVHSRMTIFYSGASAYVAHLNFHGPDFSYLTTYVSNSAGGFSGLLAYAIGQLDYEWGYRGWRFIYCIEGIGNPPSLSYCEGMSG